MAMESKAAQEAYGLNIDDSLDIVLCKSISRFARNTVDLLETVRHLKSLGIDVWFEKENIQSLSADGDVLRSALIQCNDGVLVDRPLDIWVLARRQSFLFFGNR